VTLFDETSFAKFLLQGPDVEQALSWICANDIRRPAGRLIYTQLCNKRGGIEADLTVCRIAEDSYYVITGTGFAARDFNWITTHIPEGLRVTAQDVTSSRCVLGLMGPRSREVLAAVTDVDLSNEAFPFATCQDVIIAGAVVRALRVTFVGELGWELHIPSESALAVYDALMKAGQPLGLSNAGYRAIESLRLEKGYRIWGADLSPDYSPLEAGLGWALKLKSDVPFLGREALEKQKSSTLRKRLVFFSVDDPNVVLLGRETIYRDGQRVGWLSSGGFGYTLNKSVGMGYVRQESGVATEFLTTGSYELEVACQRVRCQLHLRPLYDPDNARVKQ
jgi:4-methylaminobutanoate oxidase (formaldehyde-forming)